MQPATKRHGKRPQHGKAQCLPARLQRGQTVFRKGCHGIRRLRRRWQMPDRNTGQRRTGDIRPPAVPDKKHLPCVQLRLMQKLPEQLSASLLHTVGAGHKTAVKGGVAAAAQHRIDLRLRQVHV